MVRVYWRGSAGFRRYRGFVNTGTASAWILRIVDAGFVVAVALLCWALLWCDGPFERVSWLGVLAFMAGPPLLLVVSVYFGICASRARNVSVPLVVVASMIGLSVIVIGTGCCRNCVGRKPAPRYWLLPSTRQGRVRCSIDGWAHTPPTSRETGMALC